MKHVKKSYSILVLLVLAAVLLAACGGAPPAPAVPTAGAEQATPAAPPEQPTTAAPSAQLTPATSPTEATQPAQPAVIPGQDLGNKQWQWVKTSLNDGQTFNPSNPTAYTIEFSMTDGRVIIKADCNNATGDFMTDGQSLQIMIGGVTPTSCQPGSSSEEYLKELSEVGAYQVQGDSLTLTLSNGAMTLTAGQPAVQQPPSPAGPAASL